MKCKKQEQEDVCKGKSKTMFARFFKDFGGLGHVKSVRIKLRYYQIPKNPESDYAEAVLEKPAIGHDGPIRDIDICPDDLFDFSRNNVGLALGWGSTGDLRDRGIINKNNTLNKVHLTTRGLTRDKVQLITTTVYNETLLDVCDGDSGGPLLFKKDASGWENYENLCLMATVEGGRECGTAVDRQIFSSRWAWWNYVPEMHKSIQMTEIFFEQPTTQSPPRGPPQLQTVAKGTYFKRQETL